MPFNYAYDRKQSAAADVLCFETSVIEDARAHSRPLARVPADFEVLQCHQSTSGVDAVQQARGAPDTDPFLRLRERSDAC